MVTVIIPTFRPRDYILPCLESLRNQVCSVEFEIIIVLNGDKEPYYKNIQNIILGLNFEQRCKIYYIEDSGVSLARNFGLSLVTNPYVLFIDDDDVVSSNYILELWKGLKSDNTVSICNTRTFTSSLDLAEPDYLSKKFIKLRNGQVNHFNARSFFSVVWGKMIPMDVIGKSRFNTRFKNGEDALFMALISDKIKFMKIVSENVIYYRRIRENSASQVKRSFCSKLSNSINLFFAYLKIYLSSPLKYNFLFYVTRYAAVFKTLFVKDF